MSCNRACSIQLAPVIMHSVAYHASIEHTAPLVKIQSASSKRTGSELRLCLALEHRVLESCMIRNRGVARHFEIKRRTLDFASATLQSLQ